MAKGIDVSSYQGAIDWDAVKASGEIDFAYCKATEGLTFIDDQFLRNRQECKRVGIPMGAYCFFHFDQSPVQQAEHFYNVARVQSGDLLPMVDVEMAPSGVSLAAKISVLSNFLKWVEQRVGQRIIIYTGYDFWNSSMGGSDAFAGHPCWVAAYNNDPEPPVPNGWKEVKMWQWSSSGTIPGIQGPIDLDRLYGDLPKVALNG